MANNLRVFNTNSEYQSADLVHPTVSYVIETDKVIYEPTTPPTPVFQGKWKATYSDSHTESAQCDISSAITSGEITSDNLVSVEIGDCVTSIGDSAFDHCSSLTSVTIGSGVTSIGGGAFDHCSSLTSVTIPSGVTSISYSTFSDCKSLTNVVIPSGVTRIGSFAFEGCSGLTSVTVNATTPPSLEGGVFENTNDCPIYVPSASVDAYKSAWSRYGRRIQPIP